MTKRKPVRAPRRAKKDKRTLQQRRADHAMKKWRAAKRKLKLAQTVERKWRQKVVYYERVFRGKNAAKLVELKAATQAATQAFAALGLEES